MRSLRFLKRGILAVCIEIFTIFAKDFITLEYHILRDTRHLYKKREYHEYEID